MLLVKKHRQYSYAFEVNFGYIILHFIHMSNRNIFGRLSRIIKKRDIGMIGVSIAMTDQERCRCKKKITSEFHHSPIVMTICNNTRDPASCLDASVNHRGYVRRYCSHHSLSKHCQPAIQPARSNVKARLKSTRNKLIPIVCKKMHIFNCM